MAHHIPVKRVFFHVLRGNKYAFADERTRTYLLHIIDGIQKQSDWQIYAFCMTTQEAYFIIEAKSLAVLSRDLAYAAELFRSKCRALLPEWWNEAIRIDAGRGRRLMSEKEIMEYCCLLHQLPLQYGYVERLSDYWWSSYITYAGIYDWELVECTWLLGQFSKRPALARHKLKEYQSLTAFSVADQNEKLLIL